jgi:hypothetical protein
MATLPCDLCGDEPAALLITVVDTGTTTTVGGSCIPIWCKTLLGIPLEDPSVLNGGEPATDGSLEDPAAEEDTEPEPPKPKRSRRSQPATSEEETGAEAEAEAAAH